MLKILGEIEMEIVWLVTGVVIGAVIAYFFAHAQNQKQNSEHDGAYKLSEEKNNLLNEQLQEIKEQLSIERQQVIQLNNQLASREADFRNLNEKLQEQKSQVNELQQKFSIEFKNLANEIFEEKSKKFTDQNKSNLTELLNPLKEKIIDFEKKVEQNSKESLEQSASLKEQLKNLRELNQQMSKEAENLTRALKGDSKAQGNWGEFILESILEKSGLEKGREYLVQESFTDESGRRFQPDVIINLPESKNLIIDSKVSLIAYERFVSAATNEEQTTQLKTHIQSIRTHLKQLDRKKYHSLYGVDGLDFVLMFIPIEPAFSLAVQHDGELFNDAYQQNIVIVSPSTLIATLRTIANIWKNEYQNRNALEIARQSGSLYDKFTAFTEDLIKVGKNIQQTQGSYQDAMNKLVDGKDNLIRKTERLRELGAKTSKSIDQKLIDRSEEH
ncbi:MAG: DNA recombination protein RmuC [Candidatus Cyclobacteriaceae bacterium M2_1C_046]